MDVRTENTDVYGCWMGWFPPTGIRIRNTLFSPQPTNEPNKLNRSSPASHSVALQCNTLAFCFQR
jgi:hypothetical protein